MLSAHNANNLIEKNEQLDNEILYLKDLYFDSQIKLDTVEGVMMSFVRDQCDLKYFKEALNHIKHKRQLELAKKCIAVILKVQIDHSIKLLHSIDGVKESVMLALGNQICFILKNFSTVNFDKKTISFLSTVEKVVKKIIILNYLLSKENKHLQCEFRDIWNGITVLQNLDIQNKEIPELTKIIDFEKDYWVYKNNTQDCFCRHLNLLPIESKRQLIQIESKVLMRQELQV